jgi:hypothetical protein
MKRRLDRMKVLVTLMVWMAVMIITLPVKAQEIMALLPALEQLDGWKLQQAPEVYPGENLFDLIDGGADIYFEYGFTQVVSADYLDPALNITQAEIYEMTDPSSAYGIFSLSQQAVGWGTTYGQLSVVTDDYIAFWKGRYYVNISWSSRQDPGSRPMETLAGRINSNILETGDYPLLVTRFEALDPTKRAVFLRGNLALSNFYYFDYKDFFEISQALACSPGDHHRIVMEYADGARSLQVLASAKQYMISNKRFTDVAMIYQGFTCKDNKGNQILVRQEDRYLIVLVSLQAGVSLNSVLDGIIRNIEEQQKL